MKRFSNLLLWLLASMAASDLALGQAIINCDTSIPCNQVTGPSGTNRGDPAWKAFGKDNANSQAIYAFSLTCVLPLSGCGLISSGLTLSLGLVPSHLGGSGVNNNDANTESRGGVVTFAGPFATTGNFAVNQTYTGITTVTFPAGTYTAGYIGSPVNPQNCPYTLVASDAGKTIVNSNSSACAYTIPSFSQVPFPLGTCIVFRNALGAGVLTAQINSDTLAWSATGTTEVTGNRTIANDGLMSFCKFDSTTRWIVTGTVGVQ